jgi:hypothetical protein
MAEQTAVKFVRGPETTALVNELRKLKPGESVSESALSAAVGFDVTRFPENVRRAREIILKEGGGVIDVAENGWRRLTDSEAVNIASERYVKKARNAGERGARSLTSVQYDALPDPDKVTHNVRLSMLGAMRLVFSPKARRQLENVVTSNGAALPSAEAMKLFEKVK